ncbi:MAG: phosphoadenylyl-sulfate reductase [Alphaproteobacteria bacterium]
MSHLERQKIVKRLIDELSPLSWQERFVVLRDYQNQRITFSTSFSYPDQSIVDLIAKNELDVNVFTLDTGRLFEETHTTFQKTRDTYPSLLIKAYYPDTEAVEELIKQQGINAFYDSIEKRQNCCHVRKVEPLQRALSGYDIWISGLQREQSQSRHDLPIAEYDEVNDIIKLYPLIDVSSDDILRYVKAHNVPYNILHDQGFPSIGCAPCTRSVELGAHPRSGRWWWEKDKKQECGLHIKDGKLERVHNNA